MKKNSIFFAAVILGACCLNTQPVFAQDVGTFNELKSAIQNSTSDTINIIQDININSNIGSMGSNSLIVDGNTNSLNGNGYNGVNVSSAKNLIIRNIGSPDLKYDSSGNLISKSINGFTANQGGFLNFKSSGNLTISDSTFYNNVSQYEGGAVYADGADTLLIENSKFINNSSATNRGGAVASLNTQNTIIRNSYFGQNSAMSYSGGALYVNSGNLEITDTTFENNTAGSRGAIYAFGLTGLKIDNSKFSGHVITSDNPQNPPNSGAAVSLQMKDSSVKGIISNTIFENNEIVAAGKNGSGGALSLENPFGSTSNFILDTVTFKGNKSNAGGAIINQSNLLITGTADKHSVFDGNEVTGSSRGGGAIYTSNGQMSIEYTTFKNNKASVEGKQQGGAIQLTGAGQTTIEYIKNSEFINNSSGSEGGAIQAYSGQVKLIENTLFKENKALSYNGSSSSGGAISLGMDNYYVTKGIKPLILNSEFLNNEAVTNGGAIYLEDGSNKNEVYVEGSKFVENTAGSYGGAIYSAASKVFLKDSHFEKNNSSQFGGAVFMFGPLSQVENTTFKENSTTYSGGAIYLGNTSTDNQINITGSTFENNKAGSNGGAIYVTTNKILIDGSEFLGNTASNGGAIATSASNKINSIIVSNSKFLNNEATKGYGGALYLDSSTSTNPYYIVNSYFENNTATKYGGAVYNANKNIKTVFADTSFVNNKAKEFGGAIFTWGDLAILADKKDVIFEGNSGSGADIYFGKDMDLAASEGKKIEFNSGLNAGSTSILNINENPYSYVTSDGSTLTTGNTGNVHINNYAHNMTINLYGGGLYIGQNNTVNSTVANADGFINNTNLNIKGNSIINTINNKVGTLQPKEFKVDSGVDWDYQFDIDLANKTSDKIVVTDNSGNLNLSKLNIFSDTDEENIKVTYSDTNLNAILKEGYKITTSANTYKIAAENSDTDGSSLIISRDNSVPVDGGGLAGAIANASDVFTNTSGKDEIVENWFGSDGNQLKNDLEIDANNLGIITEKNIEGIVIQNDKTLTINDALDFSGFNNAVTNDGTLNINNSNFTNNTGNSVITNNGGTVNISSSIRDVIFDNSVENSILSDGGEINISGNNTVIFGGNVTGSNDTTMNISSDVDFHKEISGVHIVHTGGNVLINSHNNASYSLQDGTLNLKSEENFLPDTLLLGGGNLNMANGNIGTVNVNNLVLNSGSTTNFGIDVDLRNEQMDRLLSSNFDIKSTFDDVSTSNGLINVNHFNMLSDTNKSFVSINFTDSALKDYITTDIKSAMGPIYNYGVSYDKETGNFNFMGGGSNSSGYNPAVLASPIAAQLGGYLTQLNSYDEAFRNMDMYMLLTKKQRDAMKLRNKYAAADSNLIFDPTMSRYFDRAGWVRPYATFENVPLRNGPKVSNVAYGSFFGVDSELYDLGHGWDGMWGVYAGYNGSHQAYNGIGIYQNGGTLGAVGMAYKGNFFTGLTINTGANAGEASTMYGQDNFSMIMAGIASKTGYNFEMADGKFIIQPNFLMSYSFVNTFDYTNAAGVKIDSDPLNAIQIEPGIKFIGNLKNGWQPYASVSMVWNIMDRTHFQANDVSLPNLSVKPFVRYGVGVQKRWGERFTGFFQTYFTNGGRNGVGLQAGFRFAIGKSKPTTNKKTESKVIKSARVIQ